MVVLLIGCGEVEKQVPEYDESSPAYNQSIPSKDDSTDDITFVPEEQEKIEQEEPTKKIERPKKEEKAIYTRVERVKYNNAETKVSGKRYESYDKAGNLIKEEFQSDEYPYYYVIEYKYDAHNNVLEVKRDGEIEDKYEYDYNDHGDLIKNTHLVKEFEGGNVYYKEFEHKVYDYKYNEYGEIIEKITSTPGSDNLTLYETNEYDDYGNKIVVYYKDHKKEILRHTEYKYDENGLCMQFAMYGKSGNIFAKLTYFYDTNGNCIKTESNVGDENSYSTYKYDEKNRRIEEYSSSDHEYVYYYYD